MVVGRDRDTVSFVRVVAFQEVVKDRIGNRGGKFVAVCFPEPWRRFNRRAANVAA